MATPQFANDPVAAAQLAAMYAQAHRFHSIFEFQRGLTKQEAHQVAFQRFLAMKRMQQQQR